MIFPWQSDIFHGDIIIIFHTFVGDIPTIFASRARRATGTAPKSLKVSARMRGEPRRSKTWEMKKVTSDSQQKHVDR